MPDNCPKCGIERAYSDESDPSKCGRSATYGYIDEDGILSYHYLGVDGIDTCCNCHKKGGWTRYDSYACRQCKNRSDKGPEEEAKKKAAEAAAQKAAEENARKKAAEVAAQKAAEEAARKKAAEVAAQKAAEEAAKKKAAEVAAQKAAEEAARKKAAEVADQKAAEEAIKKKAVEDAAKGPEEKAKKKAAEAAAQKAAEENAKTKAAEVAAQVPRRQIRDNILGHDDLVGVYKSIYSYGASAKPKKTCSECILECNVVINVPQLQEALLEVGKITQSKLSTPMVQQILLDSNIRDLKEWPMYLAAIVMYTFDLSAIEPAYSPEHNFYFQLNDALRLRDSQILLHCSGYLHYLMRGLDALPSYSSPNGLLWRGVDRDGLEVVRANYTLSRRVHWSGFSSATTSREMAQRFAGKGGALLRIRVLEKGSKGRDVRELSAIRAEDEILLLPNFQVRVTERLRLVDGFETVDLLEEADADTFVF